MTRQLVRAVLETSFWTAAHRAEVAANCLDLFEIVVPRAVEREILHSPRAPREYPYATLFRRLRGQLHDPPRDAPPPLDVFGPGEAEAIALAAHIKAHLLVNEHRAAAYARSQGVRVVTVPTIIAALFRRGVISERAARRKFDLIEPITSASIIERGRQLLDRIASA